MIDACEGLAEAHARGIIHQDVKPANLFVVTGDDGRPCVKLLDFGIATMRTAEERKLEAKSSAPRSHGTPAYLAPEQLKGAATLDHRADIWALGCVLYELLSGARAFRSQRFTELVTMILETPPEPLPAEVQVPPALAQAIDRCLAKDPAKRFHSTGELAVALMPFARRRSHASVAKAVAHVKASGIDPTLQMPASIPPPAGGSESGEIPLGLLPPEPAKRSPLVAIVLGVFVVATLGIGAFAWPRKQQKPAEISPTPSAATSVVVTPVETEAASSVASAEPIASVAVPAPTSKRSAPHPKPSASASAAPPSPDAEIRRTR